MILFLIGKDGLNDGGVWRFGKAMRCQWAALEWRVQSGRWVVVDSELGFVVSGYLDWFYCYIKEKVNNPLMSFFDDQPPKKEKTRSEIRESKGRRRDKKEKDKQKEEKPKRVYPPLMIRPKPNEDQEEQLLEDYVREMYAQRQGDGQSKFVQDFLKEDDEGNCEYKLKLVTPSDDRLDHLATQMKFRVREGMGEAHYRIGVEDNGRPTGLEQEEMLQSLRTICLLAGRLGFDVMVFKVTQGLKGLVMELVIRQRHRQGVKLEIRILLLGESGSGKSTLLGVLKSGQMDNGKGSARGNVLTHKHEFMTGSTQSRSHHVIGFDSQGRLYNQKTMMSIEKWLDDSNKLLTFIDVGGHRKAEKQLVSSLCSFFPEYALWVVNGLCKTPSSANTLELATIFGLPLIVVITHLDQMSKDEEMEAVLRIKEELKRFCPDKTPCVVKEMEHAVLFSRITSSEDVLPIFLISSLTGKNLNLLSSFLNLLTAASELKDNEELSTEFSISDKYVVDGKLILAGTVIKGSVKRGQMLHIGPDLKGSFRAVEITSIECLRVPVKLAKCGQVCTLGIRPLHYAREWLEKEPNAIRRGMVLVDGKSNPKAVYQFLVELTPYSNDREEFSIYEKYQPVINTLTTRQICQIIIMRPQEEAFIPDLLSRKKSRSIDARHDHHYRSSSDYKNSPRVAPKKSVDLTMQSCEELPKVLETIAEQPLVKKAKQVALIHFRSGKSTMLRLRFKYFPEYITIGQRVIVNELKVVGRVREIFY